MIFNHHGRSTAERPLPLSLVCKHLRDVATKCDGIILFLDCDREGEAICFEVLSVVKSQLKAPRKIYRAKFSAVTRSDIVKAFGSLGAPDKMQADAVAARQELDLKVGVAFTRFQTAHFLGKYALDARCVSYGPCQTPTLGFCVARHLKIDTFVPEPFWKLAFHDEAAQFHWARCR